MASHLGLLLGLPAVGCAGEPLAAGYAEPAAERGSWSPVRAGGKTVGSALRTKSGVRPVIVSPGHRTDLATSRRIVLESCGGFRIPEPLRRAHSLARGTGRSTPDYEA
ncbi:MAG: endonuclease V [Candidatus Glassbacteria bacterium]